MGGWIIKAAMHGSDMHTQTTACTCSWNVSALEIQLVTGLDRAVLRITAESNCKPCFDYTRKHNMRKYLYFSCLITQNISLCTLLAPPTPLFSRKKDRPVEKLLWLWFAGEWSLENTWIKCTTSSTEIQLGTIARKVMRTATAAFASE